MRWVRRLFGNSPGYTEGRLYLLDEDNLDDWGHPTLVDDDGDVRYPFNHKGNLTSNFEEVKDETE